MKSLKFFSLAAIAVTLAFTAFSCSSENDLTETPVVQPSTNGVVVTVTAGIADDAISRSEVGHADGKRTLKFTKGDRLFVMKKLSNNDVANYVGAC